MPRNYIVSGNTHVGLVRKENEDFLHIDEANQVFAVCDGMGGHQAGEIASMTASELLRDAFTNHSQALKSDVALTLGKVLPESGDLLVKAIRLANRDIYNKADENDHMKGMGTTVVALALENDMLSIAHVGDSRAYKIGSTALEPLTTDHSWVAEIQKTQNVSEEEASKMVGKNIITRALGVRDKVDVDYRMIKVKSGDKFLLCSDGLCGYADDEDIFRALRSVQSNNQKIVDSLIGMANDRGGSDNVTIIVLEIGEINSGPVPEIDLITFPSESDELLGHEDKWLELLCQSEITQDQEIVQSDRKPGKAKLIMIFALFIILAAVIIYLTLGK